MSNLNLPALLYALRKRHRLSQPEMTGRMKTQERTYRDWEKGNTAPSSHHLQELANSFERTIPDLLQVDPETGHFPPTR